jgi:hypothetical protein
MMISLKEFQNELRAALLDFTWRQWCRMGVAGVVRGHGNWIIDPEPLLAFTSEIARHDARVFDEVLDWMLQNGRWINVQRLSTIIERDNTGQGAVVGALASWMVEHDKPAKWRGLARRMEAQVRVPVEPLFLFMGEGQEASAPEMDPHFVRFGLRRQTVAVRGMTQPVNMKDPANAVFKCRALFGIGNRADVMLYLMTSGGGHPRHIAKLLGYNHMRVQELLVGLADAGVVTMRPAGRAKEYWINREKWWPVVGVGQEIPIWVDWRALVRGLTVLWRGVCAIDADRADDDIFSSKMRTVMRLAKDDLHSSGIGFTSEDDRGHIAENYLPVFMEDMRGLFAALGGSPGSV